MIRMRFAAVRASTAAVVMWAGGVAAAAVPPSAPSLHISTDHADGSYAAGEPVTWTVRIVGGAGGGPVLTPAYTVASGKDVLTNGVLRFADGTAAVTARLDRPGVLELKVDHATPWRKSFRCAVAVAWREIRSTVPEPADFDAFWKRKLDELAAVPANPVLEEVDDPGAADVRLWKITLDGIRGTRIYGYLARPRGTNALPAQVQVQYWGVYPLNRKEVIALAAKGWLAMNIMAHDLPCDREPEFYARPPINTYVNTGADDPEKSYFLRMFLSCSRAVDYLAGRDDWNRKTLLVQGGSQGGFQGLAVAALNPKVTALTIYVPGGCDLTGSLEGRPNAWPGWVYSKAQGVQREAMIRTAGYYDAKNFATRIRCPTLVGIALLDSTTSPLGQFTMFNNLTAPKRLVLLPEDAHTSPHTAYKAVQSAWWQAAAAGEPLPMK